MDDKLLQSYFEGTASDEQARLVTHWLDKEEANMQYYLRICRLQEMSLWNDEGEVQPAQSRKLFWQKAIRETLKIAAVFLFGFFLNNLFSGQDGEAVMQTVCAPAGQHARIVLGDGTKVWLNAGSTLQFPSHFSGSERSVTLEGEGFFEVRSDKKKPFIVSASGYTVKALGTSFNVCAYARSHAFEASLLSGKIEVSDPEKKQTVRLSPDHRAVLDGNKLVALPIENPEHFLWREGIICFDEPMTHVLEKLELYFDVTIEVNNKHILEKEPHYTGKFRTRDGLEHILKVLQTTSYFSYSKDDEKNRVTIH